MAFWYGLSAIVAIVVALPFARLALRRISCAKKIKGYCKEKGYKIYPTHRLWYFSGNRSERCDLYIETANEVLSVKLFGVSRRRRVLIFKDDVKAMLPLPVPCYILLFQILSGQRPSNHCCYTFQCQFACQTVL